MVEKGELIPTTLLALHRNTIFKPGMRLVSYNHFRPLKCVCLCVCVCITMCSLVMSLFSRDHVKMEMEYQTYLQVYSTHTAPGF